MIIIELACLLIVAFYVIARGRRDLKQLVLLSISSFIAEDTVIRAYGFYTYSPEWSIFIDRVPLMIILIWPVVISSACDLAKGRALPAAAIVLFDASLIEPIAVRAGLWTWHEPGLFHVPPIGILGWALFAYFAIKKPLIAPLVTHFCLIVLWWVFFRWVNVDLPEWIFAVAIWVLSIALVIKMRARVARRDLWLRVPAALFFFVLLGIYGRSEPALIVYALAFAPPYIAQMLIMQKPATQTSGAQQSRSLVQGAHMPDI
jgi:hypothetical protein